METHVKGSSVLHNHFVINSVSVKDGKKYRWQKGSYRQLRKVSDELCRQHQLSIIENQCRRRYRGRYGSRKSKERSHGIIFCGTILTALYGAILLLQVFLASLGISLPGYVVVRDSKYKHLSVITEGWSNPLQLTVGSKLYSLKPLRGESR